MCSSSCTIIMKYDISFICAMRILVVDDDRHLCSIIKRGLVEESYSVDTAFDGEEGEYMATSNPYDLIILDIMMPKKDGIEVCRSLRLRNVNSPVMMLTAKDTVEDRVKGLDTGADDYLVKPFAFSELLARVRALLRRDGTTRSPEIKVGDLILNTRTRELSRGGRAIDLTTKEYTVLEYLMHHPNVVITRTMIEEHAWDYDFDSISNLVDVYIRRLRRKIDDSDDDSIIQTVRGAGYRLRAQ